MESQERKLLVANPQQGQHVSVLGGTYRIVVSGSDTGGDFAVIEMLVPPGGGPGPHKHPAFHESFQVLEGEVTVRYETETVVAKAGDYVNIPKGGGVHQFKNMGGTMARLWCTIAPAGEEAMFLEIGQPVSPGAFLPAPEMTPQEQQRTKAITEKYGQTLYPPDYFDRK
jgi:mannose-6-phosphate isomerase-like protein (cupin superfamily)